MNDVLCAINAALLPLSALYLYYFANYQYLTRSKEKRRDVSIYAWSVFFMSIAVFVSSIFFFLHDFDIIFRSTQVKLSLITRIAFVASLLLAYNALEIAWGNIVILVSACLFVTVFLMKVLF